MRPARQRLTGARRRAQPAAFSIFRLTVTGMLAFLVAHLVTGAASVLAPLTALLVVQVTLYHTFRVGVQRVASVVAGVLVALGVSSALGFTWWSLGMAIAASLIIGYALRLGDSALEVPISAMLILSLPTEPAAMERILATVLGAATGMVSNLVVSPLRVQPAEDAVADLGQQLADLLDTMANHLASGIGPERTGEWIARARHLTAELERVESALGQAEESVKLNPRRTLVTDPRVYLRRRLETLERVTLTIRGIARSLKDIAAAEGSVNPVRDMQAADLVAGVLRALAAALRPYARLAGSAANRAQLKAEVDQHLDAAEARQRIAVDLLRADSATSVAPWPLRGELLTHLDRLRTELRPAAPRLDGRIGVAQAETWRRPVTVIRDRWRQRRGRALGQ